MTIQEINETLEQEFIRKHDAMTEEAKRLAGHLQDGALLRSLDGVLSSLKRLESSQFSAWRANTEQFESVDELIEYGALITTNLAQSIITVSDTDRKADQEMVRHLASLAAKCK